MRINSWRVCNIQHCGLCYETFTQTKCSAMQITYLYEKPNSKVLKYITITSALYTKDGMSHTTLLSICYRNFFLTLTHSILLTKLWHDTNTSLRFANHFIQQHAWLWISFTLHYPILTIQPPITYSHTCQRVCDSYAFISQNKHNVK